MSKYDWNKEVDRIGTSSFKTDSKKVKDILKLNSYDDTIYLWVADMDFACAPEILKVLHDRVDNEIFGYTYKSDEYNESIINWYKRRHDIDIDANDLIYSNGTVAGIRNIIRALTDEGDGIIIQEPVYYPFATQIKGTNRKIVSNKLLCDFENNYSIDFIDFEKKARDRHNKIFMLCNPHNPVGQIWSESDVKRMMEICETYDIIVIADEIHCDLIRKDAKFVSAYNLYNGDKMILATAANKTFNLAGLQITNFVINNMEIRKKIVKYTGDIFVNPFAVEATIAGYNEGEEWVKELNEVLDDNFDFMEEFIKENLPKARFNKPEGTYLALIDFRDYGLSEAELLCKIADEAHVILEGGAMFGNSIEGFVRLNAACPKHVLEEALTRIADIFKQ
ncbi:MAG: pyridoxal phosphate-dependent aminotransferase [Peptostreptococcaceae bacterium]|nr:pyridoxal phosphate-dependent aminotransferase [Peptostreptococcaceae bacterium]